MVPQPVTHETFRDAILRLSPDPLRLTQPSRSWGDHDRWRRSTVTTTGAPTTPPDLVGFDARGPDELGREGRGLWRYVDGGRRFLAGDWPEEPFPAFDEGGTVTVYDEVPAGEASPDYAPLPPVSEPES